MQAIQAAEDSPRWAQLVRQAVIAGGKVDDAAVGESVRGNTVLHNVIITVGVYADVGFALKSPVQDASEDAVGIRGTAHSVNDVIRPGIIQPGALVNLGISWFRRSYEGKVAHNASGIGHNIAIATGDIGIYNGLRWISAGPLKHIAGGTHYASGCIQNGHYSRDFLTPGEPYFPA